ncbi:DUF29 domain-containing protein [Tardiphaga alba]|uniref:DUF29 domain-containing protein n=1 Tax=Tardiphaga alba TaxID=340268 RepID=A0ABX8A485_9BRAD|nr:DUF29 domain-containing protein [Tardiphaga alba]QUS38461.1 DUF29 domain-containing protein [Tardiphaga alba]
MDARTYELDFFEWTQQQAAALRSRPLDVNALDTERLAEEIEDMGREQIRRTSSFLVQMLVHLFKLHLDPKAPSVQRWFKEVLRFQADAVLSLSPGIKQRLDLDTIWRLAKRRTTAELARHNIVVKNLPDVCPLSLDAMLDVDFDTEKALQTIAAAIT